MIEFDSNAYPMLAHFTREVPLPQAPIVGREEVVRRMMADFERFELCNVMLLGEAGIGKTSVVQAAQAADDKHTYIEVDVASLLGSTSDSDKKAAMVSALFNEVIAYHEKPHEKPLVVFIDEFHTMVKGSNDLRSSSESAQAIKQSLAAGGHLGLRFVAATTFDEYHSMIEADAAFGQRFDDLRLEEPDRDVVVKILASRAHTVGFEDDVVNAEALYGRIYDLTQRFIPADAQPRKSIKVLDGMYGWYKSEGMAFDEALLARVVRDQCGAMIQFSVDIDGIQKSIEKRVLYQHIAVSTVMNRIQICSAGLNDPEKPFMVLMFAGSTGVGKTELAKALSEALYGNSRAYIRFDMSEYSLDSSVERFRETLCDRMWERPFSLLLLDELEKASPLVHQVLLSVIDDGRLTNAQGRLVSFVNASIIATTNGGAGVFEQIQSVREEDDDEDTFMRQFQRVLRRALTRTDATDDRQGVFAPEFLGRFSDIVYFNTLDEEAKSAIAGMKIRALARRVKREFGFDIVFKSAKDGARGDFDRLVEYTAVDSADDSTVMGGARQLAHIIDDDITLAIARYVNYNRLHNISNRRVRLYVAGTMRSENEYSRRSTAKIALARVN